MHLKLPKHLAIIMDGNGRWAKSKGKTRIFGHVKGAKVAKSIITKSAELGIKNLTLYAFSSENWARPMQEVSFLMNLFKRYLRKEANELLRNNIKFTVIGDITRLPKEVMSVVIWAQNLTHQCTGMNLTFAVSYGSQQEVITAIKKIAHECLNQGLEIEKIDEEILHKNLWSAHLPDVDFLIRTSGEKRISNFMLWQLAYAELFFTDTLWPDFSLEEFDFAISDYSLRQRRFGKVIHNEVIAN